MTHEDRLGPPPIEPLSEAAWSRVERGVWSHLDGTARVKPSPAATPRWWLAAVPVGLAAAIAAIWLATRGPTPDAMVAGESSRIVSGSAPAAISFGDIHIALDAGTAVVTSREAGRPTVVLERGAAWFTVAPRQQRPAVTVRAGDATITVVGTRFRVTCSDEQSTVEVDHGLVEVRFHGGLTKVGANQRWSSASPGPISSAAATPAPDGSPADPRAAAGPTLDAAPATTAPTPAPPPVQRPAATAPVKTTPAPRPKPTTEPGSATDVDRIEYDRLAALEPVAPEPALAGYLALARRASRWADPALFAAARLAADRHDRRARALIELYLERFPEGANAADAKHLRARLE